MDLGSRGTGGGLGVHQISWRHTTGGSGIWGLGMHRVSGEAHHCTMQ